MSKRRVGGILFLRINGELLQVKSQVTYDLGRPKRDAVLGPSDVHGYTEKAKVPYMECTITDSPDLSSEDLQNLDDGTVVLEVPNGKIITLREAWYAGEGTQTTDEGEISCRWEGISADEIIL